jgi:hypothetical protein
MCGVPLDLALFCVKLFMTSIGTQTSLTATGVAGVYREVFHSVFSYLSELTLGGLQDGTFAHVGDRK